MIPRVWWVDDDAGIDEDQILSLALVYLEGLDNSNQSEGWGFLLVYGK